MFAAPLSKLNRSYLGLVPMAVWVMVQEVVHPYIFRPLNRSVLDAKDSSVIARVSGEAELLIDGKLLPTIRLTATVLTTEISTTPGLHELSLKTSEGMHKLSFFVRSSSSDGDPPEGWKAYRVHPPEGECTPCHMVEAGVWKIKGRLIEENCFSCHNRKETASAHAPVLSFLPDSHTFNNLAECHRCHDPHGSTERAHLKTAGKISCKRCHG